MDLYIDIYFIDSRLLETEPHAAPSRRSPAGCASRTATATSSWFLTRRAFKGDIHSYVFKGAVDVDIDVDIDVDVEVSSCFLGFDKACGCNPLQTPKLDYGRADGLWWLSFFSRL